MIATFIGAPFSRPKYYKDKAKLPTSRLPEAQE